MIYKTARIVFISFSILIALYPLAYFFPTGIKEVGLLSSKNAETLSNIYWNYGFYGHILFGGLALLIGWVQFLPDFRKKNISLHRIVGKVYVVAVLLSGLCAASILNSVSAGVVGKLGFGLLSAVWVMTTLLGFTSIRKGALLSHQRWMILSYAACWSAVTLRLWLPLSTYYFDGNFFKAYTLSAWLCWVPNIVFALWLISRQKKGL